MNNRFFIVVNWVQLHLDNNSERTISEKHLIPLGSKAGYLSRECNVTVKYKSNNKIVFDNESKIYFKNDNYYLNSKNLCDGYIKENKNRIKHIFFLVEGTDLEAQIIVFLETLDSNLLTEIDESEPTLRLETYDLPPHNYTFVDTHSVVREIYNKLIKIDEGLFSIQTERFLKSPSILSYLFTHIMSLKSSDNIHFISQLKKLSDQLRELLLKIDFIRFVPKDHHKIWGHYYGNKISFLDGGVSRIVGLPGAAPCAIRVGVYSVTPGEIELNKREDWNLYPFIMGDILNDRKLLLANEVETDTRKLIEAARYILEPITALNHIQNEKTKSDIFFLHGPLVNQFVMYDEEAPNGIPGLSKGFLKKYNISCDDVSKYFNYVPRDSDGNLLWNQPIPIYGFILKKIFEQNIPLVGVIERSNSRILIETLLQILVDKNIINESYRKKYLDEVKKYEIKDDFLFGCLLNEGEYLEPIKIIKNKTTRAHDRWQDVISQYPVPYASVLKVSNNKFPYRVELNSCPEKEKKEMLFGLLFHTSLLLPNYVFPVGLDIVDKYAKIPDWLSRGVSSSLTAFVLSKALQTGDPQILMSVRQLLASSPRDFFFRPNYK